MNTFYLLSQYDNETTSVVSLFFNGADSDTTTAGISGETFTNGVGFTPYDPALGSSTYTTPGGLTTLIGGESVTLTNLQISNMGLGPFPNGTTVGYNTIEGDDTADVVLVTLYVVPEPSTWALLILGAAGLGVMTLRRCGTRVTCYP